MFFFFKQKTAYEMRISDWSSDVCSSDLLRLADHPIAAQYRHASGDVFKLADIAWPVVRFEQHDRGGVELLAGQPRLGGAIADVSCAQGDEIGSASGRGRVCQYV